MILTYKVPKPIKSPFVKGEIVEACDRDLIVMEEVKVVYAGKRVIRTNCGRTWRATDGHWVGTEQTFPFPSIRHKKKSARGPTDGK